MIKETTIVKLKYTLELLADKKITLGEQVSEVTINGEDEESIMFNQYLNTIKEENAGRVIYSKTILSRWLS